MVNLGSSRFILADLDEVWFIMVDLGLCWLFLVDISFANRAAKHSKFSKWFKLRPEAELNTRRQKTKYLPVASGTARYGSCPLPYLTAILNGND